MSLSQELCPTLNHFLGLNIPGVRSQRNGGLCSPVAPPMPPTLNISSPASHSYENLPFWSCFLLILHSWLLVPSSAPLSSLPPHPSSHAPVQSGLVFSGLRLFSPCIHNKILLLNRTSEQSCPLFHCPGAPQTQLIPSEGLAKSRLWPVT